MSNAFPQDDYFKIDPECHLIGDMGPINHFPGVQMWWRAIDNIRRPLTGCPPKMLDRAAQTLGMEAWEMEKNADPGSILRAMDKYGMDIACLLPESMMDSTGYTSRWVTNGEMARGVESNPDRFLYEPNLSPIKFKGVDNTIWELEYWVKERGARLFKYYPPEDTYINDKRIWPFYKRCEELDVAISIHTGWSWCPPGSAKYCQPVLLDDVVNEFYDLKIIAFHAGYPETKELNMVALTHPKVYISLSLLMPWYKAAPRRLAEIIGEAIQFAGPDRIVWGTDFYGPGGLFREATIGLRTFEMPEDLQKGYGFAPVTEEVKRKIFGENLAGILGIDTHRRIK